jgi:hypothetical protein
VVPPEQIVPGPAKVPGIREGRLLAMRAHAADGDGEGVMEKEGQMRWRLTVVAS